MACYLFATNSERVRWAKRSADPAGTPRTALIAGKLRESTKAPSYASRCVNAAAEVRAAQEFGSRYSPTARPACETLVGNGRDRYFLGELGLAFRRPRPTPGRLTQRLECHPHTVEVTGSNPVPPIRLTTNPGPNRQFSRQFSALCTATSVSLKGGFHAARREALVQQEHRLVVHRHRRETSQAPQGCSERFQTEESARPRPGGISPAHGRMRRQPARRCRASPGNGTVHHRRVPRYRLPGKRGPDVHAEKGPASEIRPRSPRPSCRGDETLRPAEMGGVPSRMEERRLQVEGLLDSPRGIQLGGEGRAARPRHWQSDGRFQRRRRQPSPADDGVGVPSNLGPEPQRNKIGALAALPAGGCGMRCFSSSSRVPAPRSSAISTGRTSTPTPASRSWCGTRRARRRGNPALSR